jgi:hypothetical protein
MAHCSDSFSYLDALKRRCPSPVTNKQLFWLLSYQLFRPFELSVEFSQKTSNHCNWKLSPYKTGVLFSGKHAELETLRGFCILNSAVQGF